MAQIPKSVSSVVASGEHAWRFHCLSAPQEKRIAAAYCMTCAIFLGLVLLHFDPTYGFTSFIRFGEGWESHRLTLLRSVPYQVIPHNYGYDGQFYAQIALDPLLRNPELNAVVDSPGYRSRRILQSWVAHVLGLGNPYWVLQVFSVLNVGCWFVLAALLVRWLPPISWCNYARWVACLFSVGSLESVRGSLTDLPAVLFFTLSIHLLQSGRKGWAISALSIGALAREQVVLGVVNLWQEKKMNTRAIRVWLLQTIIVILPLALWLYYVSTRFPVATGINQNLGFPLVAMGKSLGTSLRSTLHAGVDFRHFPLPFIIVSLLFQVCVLCAYKETDDPWWRIGVLYAALLLVIGDAMWGSWWTVCRVVLPLTISFNLLLKPDRRFWLFYAMANFPIALGIVRFV